MIFQPGGAGPRALQQGLYLTQECLGMLLHLYTKEIESASLLCCAHHTNASTSTSTNANANNVPTIRLELKYMVLFLQKEVFQKFFDISGNGGVMRIVRSHHHHD
jgi:hypothetical protein